MFGRDSLCFSIKCSNYIIRGVSKIGSSVKTVKLKIDPKANKGKMEFLELTRQMINLELDFYNQVVLTENLDVKDKFARNKLEALTHQTKTNANPKYPIEKVMVKSPSITKRSIINASIGQMQSYFTRLEKWEDSNSKKGKPNLPKAQTMPTFYYSDFKIELADIKNQFVKLRVFTGEKWEFVNYPVKFTKQFNEKYEEHQKSLEYKREFKKQVDVLIKQGVEKSVARKEIRDKMGINPYYEMCSPSLTFKNNIWCLAFPFEKKIYVKSVKKQLEENSITRTLAVDLGLNHLAVVTIMEGEKLIKTEFVSGAKINDSRYSALKKITKKQRQSGKLVKGEKSNKNLWKYISNLNNDTAHQVSARIVNLAKEYGCQIIIFEHLKNFSKNGKTKAARLNLKLNYWLHGKIVKFTNYKAYGEKILTVERSPFMTSQIHYKDNTVGERFSPKGEIGKSLILFEDGKVLNADFNASLNMHRKFFKTFPKVKLKEVQQKRRRLKKQLQIA